MKLNLSVSAVCDIGRVKPNNEDMILIQDEMFRDGKKQAAFGEYDRLVIAVADGVGGLNKGEVASEKVLTSLRDFLKGIPDDLSAEELHEVFNTYTSETHKSLSKDMGSTLVGLFFYNDKLFRFHAGDSRIYRLRRGELKRLTVDHSLRESGGQKDAPSNIITNSLGGGSSAYIEFAEVDNPFYNNDIYLLSSDGMHDLVPKDEIQSALEKQDAAEKLKDNANKKGGKDNISVVTITLKESKDVRHGLVHM
jgi:protein phosphatase